MNVKEENVESSNEAKPETKGSIRTKIWQDLQKKKLSMYPSPYGRIPNFKGAHDATKRLADLPEYKSAMSVEVNPDKPLEACRIQVLEDGKELYVPVPRLGDGLLKKLEKDETNDLKKIVSWWGIKHLGKFVGEDDKVAIDLLVVGSVAVSRDGYRIGKGAGYADMEFAIMKEMGLINDNTTIVTIVHDVQVLDTLPEHLFKPYDVPIDYILTPTEVIKTESKVKRPDGIYWEIVTQKRLDAITVLQKLRKRHEAEGKPVAIKNTLRKRRFYRPKKDLAPDSTLGEGDGGQPPPKQERQDNAENIPPSKTKRLKKTKKPAPSYSLLVSNIQKGVKAKDLKVALQEKGIKPSWITWRGFKGFCKLHYTAKAKFEDLNESHSFSIDNVIELIQKIRLSPDSTLEVKVVEPITRIETMNVTAV